MAVTSAPAGCIVHGPKFRVRLVHNAECANLDTTRLRMTRQHVSGISSLLPQAFCSVATTWWLRPKDISGV